MKKKRTAVKVAVLVFLIACCKQQAPHRIRPLIQLTENNLFIKCRVESFSLQQIFHNYLNL